MEVSSHIIASLTELDPTYSTSFVRILLRTLCLLLFQALSGAAISCSSSLFNFSFLHQCPQAWLCKILERQQKSKGSDNFFLVILGKRMLNLRQCQPELCACCSSAGDRCFAIRGCRREPNLWLCIFAWWSSSGKLPDCVMEVTDE